MKTLQWIVLFAALLAAGACKKEDEAAGGAAANAAPASPPVDCAKLLAKIVECGDEFWKAWEGTEQAKTTGGGDPVKGTETLKNFLLQPTPNEQLCKEMWGQKDNRWNTRYNKCWETPDCAAWIPCATNALGNMLPRP